jgi:hypothetical protein
MVKEMTETGPGASRGDAPGSVSGYHHSMTQRSIQAGLTPTVIIRAGGDVMVEGWDSERVAAENDSRGGLKVGRRSETEFGRLRAVVGDHVLLDLRADLPKRWRTGDPQAIEVQLNGSGRVRVPLGSTVKVYAGRKLDLSGVAGRVSIYTGGDARLRAVGSLVHASCGGALDVECRSLEGSELKLEAGRDLRCQVKTLDDARVLVSDLGGSWEGRIGAGRVTLRLKAGGDVTLVTDQKVLAQGPDFVIGRIERPQ